MICVPKKRDYILYNIFNNNSPITIIFGIVSRQFTSHRKMVSFPTSLPDDICLSLGTALIQSRLDYSNSVLYGTSISNLHKL